MKIALIGLSCLQAHGLRAIICSEHADCEVTIYDNARIQGWQQADCYIVSAAALAILARFLMSRLDRVLLLTSSAPENPPMQMLSPLASKEEVSQAIKHLISNGVAETQMKPEHPALSPREIDVIRLTAAGVTSRMIAEKLCISQNTVFTHRKNIAAKTGLHTVSAITHYAMIHGLLQ